MAEMNPAMTILFTCLDGLEKRQRPDLDALAKARVGR
jgi:hypothetical protein